MATTTDTDELTEYEQKIEDIKLEMEIAQWVLCFSLILSFSLSDNKLLTCLHCVCKIC